MNGNRTNPLIFDFKVPPEIAEQIQRKQQVRDLYALLNTPEITETERNQLIKNYARKYLSQHNQAVSNKVMGGRLLDEAEFEAQIRADYEKLRSK